MTSRVVHRGLPYAPRVGRARLGRPPSHFWVVCDTTYDESRITYDEVYLMYDGCFSPEEFQGELEVSVRPGFELISQPAKIFGPAGARRRGWVSEGTPFGGRR